MQKERLVIKNFGPIKSVDLELGKMTILIGEQATGKSTIAKVLAVCRYFDYLTTAISLNENISEDFNNNFENGLKQWGLYEFINENSEIGYECDNYSLNGRGFKIEDATALIQESGSNTRKNINKNKFFLVTVIEKTEIFSELFEYIEEFKENSKEGFLTQMPVSFYQNQVAKIMDNPFYIPTERGLQSIFSLGKSSIQNISDSLFNQFAKMDMFARNFNKETEIKPLNILYKNVNGQGFIKNERQTEFSSLYNGASGYQSIIPVVLAIKYYSENRRKRKTFIVEEPELNLFPKAQKKLMEFFVENINQNGHSFLLPTHSPYILSAINNMMYAHSLGNKDLDKYMESVKEIINKEFWIDANDISAYYLKDGFANDIVNREESQIRIDDLDSVSEIINEEFDKLLGIEVENQL